MITGMVATLIAASALIPIDQVVTARGIVVSRSPTILVQPLDTSIVRSIEVHEGQRVNAGDVLARPTRHCSRRFCRPRGNGEQPRGGRCAPEG